MRELEKLTDAERLVIDRRRWGLSQTVAARVHGVGRKIYQQWETGVTPTPKHVKLGNVLPLKLHEVAYLYRRRAGKSRAEVAHDLGMSAWWVTQMERGYPGADPAPLIEYWEC